MNSTKLLLPASLFLAMLGAGCGTVSPLYVLPSGAPKRSFPPAPPALIRLPVTLTVPQVEDLGNGFSDLIHGHFKKGFPEIAHWTGHQGFQFSKKLALWNVTGGKLFLGTTLRWLESAGKKKDTPVTYGSPDPPDKSPNDLRVSLPVQWGKDWSLTILAPTPVIDDGKKSFPRKTAETILRLEQTYTHIQLDQLNKVLKSVTDLRPKVKDIWALMQQPIYLDKGIWLLIHPENISTGLMRSDPHNPLKLMTVLEMWAYPVIFFGDNPIVDRKPLPPLNPFQAGPPGFRAISNVFISYKEANRFLRDPSTGLMNCVIPGTGDQKLTVRGIRLYGSGGKVIAEVKLTYNPFLINLDGKPAKMTLYFRGTPQYSLKKRLFYLPDLDFDVKTSDFLMQVADWILKSDIRKELRKKARIPVGQKLDSLKDRMNVVLNRPLNGYASLATQVKKFDILDSFADDKGIQARVALDGDAQLNVAW
ncbi:MAG TPA: DUF4403 family protein [bacterium]|nr:DUF4403 family protein [bacterium]